jgi:hypothetical protein
MARDKSPTDDILPSGSLVKRDAQQEMVCGKCGPHAHDVYLFSVPDTITGQVEPLNPESAKGALCLECGELRPLNTLANEVLYSLKVINSSEYLSWSDGTKGNIE